MDFSEIDSGGEIAVHAGFPNAGNDASLGSLRLERLLVPRPNSTFYFRLRGNQWQSFGVFDGDLVIVDRLPTPTKQDVVVYWHTDRAEFCLNRGRAVPAEMAIWGCVTSIIHQLRRS